MKNLKYLDPAFVKAAAAARSRRGLTYGRQVTGALSMACVYEHDPALAELEELASDIGFIGDVVQPNQE